MRSLTSLFLILSIAAIIICGVMACIDFLSHYSLIAGSLPVQAFAGIVALIAFILVSVAAIPAATLAMPLGVSHRGPDPAVWRPLQIAFSDGILNTKVF